MHLFVSFCNHIENNFSFLKEKKLLIAISGGLDSVVLTHLCYKFNLRFSLAHCNFNLRGEESDGDEDFVLQLAEALEVEVFIQNFDTESYAKEHKLSIQMAARTLRYHWFEELAKQLHFDYILTAHHADDNLETFLINLSRGTGLDGLVGIPEKNGKLIRPFLPFSRMELETYAEENKLEWREDSSNASNKYLRNKLRLEVIPILKEINPELLQNFSKTQSYLQKSKQIVDLAIDKIYNQVVDEVMEDSIYFNIKKLKQLPHLKACLYELFKDYGFSEWNNVFDLLNAQTGKFVQSNTHRLLKNRARLILFSKTINSPIYLKVSEEDSELKTPIGTLRFKNVDIMGQSDVDCIYVDKELLKFPLVVRQWENGDYFYPFGMQGKKKLSKFFKDEKYSTLAKEKALILCSGEQIVWILNKRQDNRFKITDKTQNIFKITISK